MPGGWPQLRLVEPAALSVLVLLLPLAWLYLRKQQPERHWVAQLDLWQRAADTVQSHKRWRLPRPEAAFWLTAAALLVFALAAAGPVLHAGAVAPKVALVIDVSASMQAVDNDGRSRLTHAKLQAREWLAAGHPDADVQLITAGSWAQVLAAWGAARPEVLAQLDSIEAEDTESELGAALELAQAQLRDWAGPTRIVLFTDRHLSPAQPSVAGSAELEVHVLGVASDNLAITQLSVQHEPPTKLDAVSPTQVFVAVKNFGQTAREVPVQLKQRNVTQALDTQTLHLGPSEEASVVLKFDATLSDQGAGLEVTLGTQDALAADDRAYAVVPLHARQPVVLLGDAPSPWLERALRADGGIELRTAPALSLQQLAPPAEALLVFWKTCPKLQPSSPFVVVAPPSGRCLSSEVGAELSQLQVTHWDDQDPRLRFASLDGLQVTRARSLRPDSPADALVWSKQVPLIARVRAQDKQGTIIAFDPEDSNWPLQTSFVVFVRNLVELARGETGAASRLARTGRPVWSSVPVDVEQVQMTPPSGAARSLRAHNGAVLLPAAIEAGFYNFSWQGTRPGSSLLAVSLLSPQESDLGPQREVAASSPPQPLRAVAQEQSLAWLLALLGLLLLWLQAERALRGSARPRWPRVEKGSG